MVSPTYGVRWHRFFCYILDYTCWDHWVLDLRIRLEKTMAYLHPPIMAAIFRSQAPQLLALIL
jgi:hypothetical protein